MKDICVTIGNEREKQGLSLYQLSKLSEVPVSTLHGYENGVQPTVEKADKVLKALGVSYVLGRKR